MNLSEGRIAAVEAALATSSEVDLARITPPLPERSSWSLWPDALRFLVALVAELRPHHVLEFGSGVSTRVLAWACAEYCSGGAVSSVDNDPDSSAAAGEALAQQEQRCSVSMQVAPLVIRDCGGELLPVYRLAYNELASPRPPGLVVVDGPPLPLGGREGTLYQLLPLVEPGAVIVLDDADRPEETAILERWEATLGEAIEVRRLTELTGGQAAIVVRNQIAAEELWAYRLRVLAARIRGLIPSGATFLLADGGAYGDLLASELESRPFPERDGEYWGAPEDDEHAIAEFEAARQSADLILFAWPALWWLDHYEGFAAHLRSRYRCVHQDSRLVVFALR